MRVAQLQVAAEEKAAENAERTQLRREAQKHSAAVSAGSFAEYMQQMMALVGAQLDATGAPVDCPIDRQPSSMSSGSSGSSGSSVPPFDFLGTVSARYSGRLTDANVVVANSDVLTRCAVFAVQRLTSRVSAP